MSINNNGEKPLVTVYMPTKNRLGLLKRAVKSVLSQSYRNFELIVINDGSTDDGKTLSWLDELSAKEPRLKVINEKQSLGACGARNKAISSALGQYITGLDDDDEFLPNRLEVLVENYDPKYSFISHGVMWFYGKRGKVIDAKGGVITLNDILNYNYATNQVFTETQKLKAIGGFDVRFKACQDYDTWTRLILEFGHAKMLKGYSYIQHQGHEEERITTLKNKAIGYAQYFEKHHCEMTEKNKVNHAFLKLVSQRQRYSVFAFIKQLSSGLRIKKTRYFISSNLPIFARLRSRLLK